MWSLFIASSISSVSPCVDSLVKAAPSWSGGKIGLRWDETREKFRCFWIPVWSSVCVCKWSPLPHRWVRLTFKQSNNANKLIDSLLNKTGILRNSLTFWWIVIICGLCCFFLTSSTVDRGYWAGQLSPPCDPCEILKQGWNQDMFHLRVFVIWFVCWEVGSSPAWHPAVKLPLGLAETVECGWCESGLRLAIAKARGMQLWTCSQRRVCAHTYPPSGHC